MKSEEFHRAVAVKNVGPIAEGAQFILGRRVAEVAGAGADARLIVHRAADGVGELLVDDPARNARLTPTA